MKAVLAFALLCAAVAGLARLYLATGQVWALFATFAAWIFLLMLAIAMAARKLLA